MKGEWIGRFFWGLVLISIGVIFILQQQGVVTYSIGEIISKGWPVILIFFGLKEMLFSQNRGGGLIWGGLLTAVGAMFLGRNMGWTDISPGHFFKYLVPVALIVIGLQMMIRPKPPQPSPELPKEPEIPDMPPPPPPPDWDSSDWADPGRTGQQEQDKHSSMSFGDPGHNGSRHSHRSEHKRKKGKEKSETEGWFDGWSEGWSGWDGKAENRSGFIGDVHIGQDYWQLKPMNISLFIGDTVLDLTKAQIPFGETKLHISSFIGDVKVFVPNDFDLGVNVTTSSFLGDVRLFDRHQGGFMKSTVEMTPVYAEADKKVKIIVSTFIGDVTVTKIG